MGQPSQIVLDRGANILAADTVTLAGTLSVELFITDKPEALVPNLGPADAATFPGYAMIQVSAATRPTAYDPLTGDRLIYIPPPAGGWRWESSGAPSPAQTIYGYAVCADTVGLNGDVLYMERLAEPRPIIGGTDQQVSLNEIKVRELTTGRT